MSIRERLSGNEAVATAMKQINPDVVAAFPITPSTEIPQYFSTFVSNGQVDTEFVAVESEHSAMSACIGAEAAGARAMTATSANGLSLMWEMIYIASSLRLPIVLSLVNRAVSGPLNIHNDHSDAMGVRDAGWVMLFSENNQEAYDNTIMAHRIAEHKDVQLPLMICQDGFITSHSIENIELIEDDKVKEFVGEYHPEHYLLNKKEPIAVGPLDLQAYLFEHKFQQAEAMRNAKKVILEVSKDFEKMTGRHYSLFEEYNMKDAEIAIVCMNSTAGTTKFVVDKLRAQGVKAGLLKIRVYRPFPGEEVAKALKHVKAVAVLDKADSLNAIGGALFEDVVSSLYVNKVSVPVVNYVYGIGGRDTKASDIESVYTDLLEIKENGKIDGILHAIAHANTEDLRNDFINTSRDGYAHAQDVSAYSLVAILRMAKEKDMLNEGASVVAYTYFGSEKAVEGYNVMGVAKAALEASIRYLSVDLGKIGCRVNGISAGPIKTLSAKGIKDFGSILDVVESRAPLHRNVTIKEVGDATAFLFSDLSSAITGEVIHVDNGFSCVGV